ncbi:N-acetyltransferase [Shewanella sp. UCD-KL12]|uniref:GNAT family N-acetyltransferase n=1 Tax=Shewanella sp. UCD-KL12 TaxID=1917163 RepID=UPI000970E28D|nr:GNAT family N-acetyltransferase [Shewanella sp. UCD-KL12]
MKFKFIQATQDDRAYLLKLRKLTMVEHLEKSGQFLSEAEHEFRLDDAYECSHLISQHTDNKARMVGTLKYREDNDKIEIMQLQIHPAFQGQGIGKKVVEEVLQQADTKRVELTVLKDNPALSLYQRLGFTITGEDEFEFHMQAVNS